MNGKVYIIILNYNNWYDTIECLESVLRNDYPNYQVIVIDNNSSNNSMNYIKAWAEGKLDVWVKPDHPLRHLSFPPVPKPIPYVFYTCEEMKKRKHTKEKSVKNIQEGITTRHPIIFIQSKKNLGFAGGNNIGIRYALTKNEFEYILLLNNDTVVKKNFLSLLIKNIKENNFGIAGCKIYYYHNPRKLWYNGGKFNEWFGRAVHIQKEIRKNFSEINFITGCCMLLRKDVLENVGLFDESYFMYIEDLDYCYRTQKRGFKLGIVHNSIIYHKVSSSTGEEINAFNSYWMIKNKIKFLRALPFPKRFTSLFFVVFVFRIFSLLKFFLKAKKEISIAQLKGLIDGVKEA